MINRHLSAVLFAFMAVCARADSILWEKTLIIENAVYPVVRVGHDGSVAIADGHENALKLHWFDRQGATIATPVPLKPGLVGLLYVSKDEIVAQFREGDRGSATYAMELFQLTSTGQVEQKTVNASLSATTSTHTLQYPYLLESTSAGNVFSYKLIDLTSSTAPVIVGDAVIGVAGKNLKVRWKSLSTAKYKVQTSSDLVTWTDYTDILDGTGSTIVINVPLDDDSAALYVRVVKL